MKQERKKTFLRQDGECGDGTIGRFTICLQGLSGKKILSSLVNHEKKLVIIDEVGLLEIQNKGWSACIDDLLRNSSNHLLITVRDIYVECCQEEMGSGRGNHFLYTGDRLSESREVNH